MAPVKLITSINSLAPARKKIKGEKQVNAQEKFLENPKSYQNIFFKVRARVIKEVKQQIIPKTKPNFITLEFAPKTCFIPEIASREVPEPEAPKIIKIKKR